MAQVCKGFSQEHPLVSIVIPSRNRTDYLIASLGSVFSQTYDNFEVIVVDDGSTVPLAHVLKGKFNDKITCLRNERPLGAPAARNVGFAVARGEFIAFLDDDDLWLPEKLTAQIEAFRGLPEEFGVVYCGYDFLIHDKIIKNTNLYHEDTDLALKALEGCPVGSPTPLIRKKYLDKVGGFDHYLPSCQDWDLWIRLSKVCRFYPVKKSLALYRIHGDQISTDIHKKIEARKLIIERHYNDIIKYSDIMASHYSRIGVLYALLDDKLAKKYYYMSLIEKFNIINLIHIILQYVCRRVDRYLINKFGINNINGIKLIH